MTKDNTPLVSICIPTYNGSEYIRETLNSVLDQVYTNIEIIITDDNSSDDTVEICRKYAEKDDRIKIFRNVKNLGLVGNWDECIKKASSNWIKFLFQDDILKPTCVKEMITAAIHHKVNIVICRREYLFDKDVSEKSVKGYKKLLDRTQHIFKTNVVIRPEETSKAIVPHLFENCIGEPPTFLINKKNYSKKDFPKGYYQLMDYVFILNKILVHDFVYLNEDLVVFRIHNNSESMKNTNLKSSESHAIKKQIHIHFYEKLLICEELLCNPIYKSIKYNISVKNIDIIKKWLVLKSYKKFGLENGIEFYKEKPIFNYVKSNNLLRFNYLTYKYYKVMFKSIGIFKV